MTRFRPTVCEGRGRMPICCWVQAAAETLTTNRATRVIHATTKNFANIGNITGADEVWSTGATPVTTPAPAGIGLRAVQPTAGAGLLGVINAGKRNHRLIRERKIRKGPSNSIRWPPTPSKIHLRPAGPPAAGRLAAPRRYHSFGAGICWQPHQRNASTSTSNQLR